MSIILCAEIKYLVNSNKKSENMATFGFLSGATFTDKVFNFNDNEWLLTYLGRLLSTLYYEDMLKHVLNFPSINSKHAILVAIE